MPRPEPTNQERIRQIARQEVNRIAPQLGVIDEVYPHSSPDDDSNYEVGVTLVGTGQPDPDSEGEGAIEQKTHSRVPVGVATPGASRGLEVGDYVLVQYLQGSTERPVVVQAFYTDESRAPLTEPGEYRRRIGDDAVIEIVTGDNGNQMLNIGRQPDDHNGIDMGLSMNLVEGSFCLKTGSDHGLHFDGDGNGILNWETMAMPWGAAGAVNWGEDPADGGDGDGDGDDDDDAENNTLTMTVEDESGNPVEGATVSVQADSGGDS